jgi:hypothetical protein
MSLLASLQIAFPRLRNSDRDGVRSSLVPHPATARTAAKPSNEVDRRKDLTAALRAPLPGIKHREAAQQAISALAVTAVDVAMMVGLEIRIDGGLGAAAVFQRRLEEAELVLSETPEPGGDAIALLPIHSEIRDDSHRIACCGDFVIVRVGLSAHDRVAPPTPFRLHRPSIEDLIPNFSLPGGLERPLRAVALAALGSGAGNAEIVARIARPRRGGYVGIGRVFRNVAKGRCE